MYSMIWARVRKAPPCGWIRYRAAGPRDAKVERADPLHDLAVLVTGEPLAGCVAGLAASDEVAIRAVVVITGVPVLDDPGRSYRSLDAEGHWGRDDP